jgi:hypothetical protein
MKLSHVVTDQVRSVLQLATAWGESHREAPGSHPQLPAPKQTGVVPLHDEVDCQLPLVQRSLAALPEHSSAPSWQTHAPLLQVGVLPEQTLWFTQALFTQR